MRTPHYNRDWQREHIFHMPVEGYPLKSCPGCGLVFQPRTKLQIYHNKACGVAYKYRLKREETKRKKRIWQEKHAIRVDGDIIKIPLSGRYEGQFAITDNTSKNRTVLYGKVFSCDHYGYPVTTADDGSLVHLHHLIFGKPANEYVLDHINNDKLDARLCNLREIKRGENNYNQPERKHNTSGKTGVYFNKKYQKWCARIDKDGHAYNLGSYRTFVEAAEAREKAEIELYGYSLKGSKRSARRKKR